jgi:putative transposase
LNSPEGAEEYGPTATNVLVHFIFGTRHRRPLITEEIKADLHAYLGGIIRELGGAALCVNGMADHVHLLVRMPSIYSVADVARLAKTNSSRWVHERWPQFRRFAWQPGYGAFSVSESGQATVREYILNQQQHHKQRSFEDEFVVFLRKNHIVIDEKYLWT